MLLENLPTILKWFKAGLIEGYLQILNECAHLSLFNVSMYVIGAAIAMGVLAHRHQSEVNKTILEEVQTKDFKKKPLVNRIKRFELWFSVFSIALAPITLPLVLMKKLVTFVIRCLRSVVQRGTTLFVDRINAAVDKYET